MEALRRTIASQPQLSLFRLVANAMIVAACGSALGDSFVWKNLAGIGAVTLTLAAFSLPILLTLQQRGKYRHVGEVRQGVLYRSAQLSPNVLRQFINDHGIRTVVNLRNTLTGDDLAEEHYCRAQGLRFVRIEPLSLDGGQGAAPIDAGLKRFLDVMADPTNHPVLLHCYRGVHRTGVYTAIYRVEFEKWTMAQAVAEMCDNGYDTLADHADVRSYLASYKRTGKYTLPPTRLVRSAFQPTW